MNIIPYLESLNEFLRVLEGSTITISENESTVEGKLLFSHYINDVDGTKNMLSLLNDGYIKDQVELFMEHVNNIKDKNSNLFSETAKGVIIIMSNDNRNLYIMLIDDHVYCGNGTNLHIKSGEHMFSTEKTLLKLSHGK
jgi:hypothetical protein